ncbi:hypothetical protein F2Q70_00025046 [Brassica cretica]|uniref:N(6)-L-threonylcarbamoyladenine synthase n=1 Tax=Brassica cretica TaxID=69181 RepID=A0A8S9LGI1_BRACR|nr:hypothetical protein F2Q70_00025046 [Brassica cretica]
MVRLFHTLSPAISRLNFIYPRIFLTASPSIKLQRNHVHNKLKPKISPSSSSNFQRTRAYSTTTRVSSLTKRESWKLDDDGLVVLGIETSCDDTAAAVVRGNGEILSQVISSQNCSLNMEAWLPNKLKKHTLGLLIRFPYVPKNPWKYQASSLLQPTSLTIPF